MSAMHRPASRCTVGNNGITIVGVPFGTDAYKARVLGERAQKVVSLVCKCRELPLSKQTQFLLLRSSLGEGGSYKPNTEHRYTK